jgi:hypothetical protein
LVAVAAVVAAATACGGGDRNPVLGDWALDRDATASGAVLAVESTDLASLTLREDAIVAGDTVIPVRWIVDSPRVRAVRGDGRGEHLVEVLPEGRIQVDLPIGVRAVYRSTPP